MAVNQGCSWLRGPSLVLSDLEVRLLQDADELVGRLAPVRDWTQLLEDILDQLHIVLPHSLQFGLLKVLMSLGFNQHIARRVRMPLAFNAPC